MSILIRRAEIEDSKAFNTLINGQGGQALFRASFGQYNFSSLVEYSYLSMVAYADDEICTAFASFSDSVSLAGEFDETIEALQEILPCKVSSSIIDIISGLFTCLSYTL